MVSGLLGAGADPGAADETSQSSSSWSSFDIDFDARKDLLRKFNVNKQSTLIVFKGKQEAGRSTGDISAGSIEALLGKAI